MKAVSFDFSYKFTDGKFITSYKFITSLKKKKDIYCSQLVIASRAFMHEKKLSAIKRYFKTIERKNNEIFLPKQQIHQEKKVPNMMKTMKAMVVILK